MGLSSKVLQWLAILALFAGSCSSSRPAPLAIPPNTDKWLGYDGNWSPVTILVGKPAQWVYVLPNILSNELWVIGPSGCNDSTTCIDARGGVFDSSQSKTWQAWGSFELVFNQELGVTGEAYYGSDRISPNQGPTVSDQIIGIVNNTQFYTGYLGLGVTGQVFGAATRETYLTSLVMAGVIPSYSFGYTAGAYYRLKRVPASLTLGGFDRVRYIPNDVTFSLDANARPVVALNQMLVTSTANLSTHTGSGPNWTSPLTLSSESDAALFVIDSSTPFLWLPETVCDRFANAFGLFYNETLQLYTYENNVTSPTELGNWNLTFTFTIADTPGSSKSINLTLPFDAFNLQLSSPFPGLNTTKSPLEYFPLRRAANSTQYTIGRLFLQETYLTVDYERGNFSLAQALFEDASTSDIAEIARPANSTWPGPRRSSLSVGAKVGIGVGAVAGFLLFVCLLILFLRWFRRRNNNLQSTPRTRLSAFLSSAKRAFTKGTQPLPQTGSQHISELPASKRQPNELLVDQTTGRFELDDSVPVEVEGSHVPSAYYSHESHRLNPPNPSTVESHSSTMKYQHNQYSHNLTESHDTLPRYTLVESENVDGQDSVSPLSSPHQRRRLSNPPFTPGSRSVDLGFSSGSVSPFKSA
ncbi:putative eukaryotic aspartyl protease family protein [Phaeomoniella chlamydospora]|uniref:Putative eukaryotic aspartyl protease family protein n=1 Tax=Phaeomoniella chlamydospora TaxID=158046 RepID=A0A0G2EBA4_PHACM|nr:putative eukaryotic aspartyl protease family protein [Phaeomoniella chlamydospora]